MSQNSTLETLKSQMNVICAPMHTISDPKLALAACENGIIGSLQSLNAKNSEKLGEQLAHMNESLQKMRSESWTSGSDRYIAPYAVNLIVNKAYASNLLANRGNAAGTAAHSGRKWLGKLIRSFSSSASVLDRFETDLNEIVKHKVPIVITSMGAVPALVDIIHGYGGIVLHDVTNPVHAEKAATAGVDGIIAVAAGAGGNAGTMNPFALVNSIRKNFNGLVFLAGAINTGRDILAAQAMGTNGVSMGTRFLATVESSASPEYKQEILDATFKDIVYTNKVSHGQVHGNFMAESLKKAGYNVVLPNKDGSIPARIDVGYMKYTQEKASELMGSGMKKIGIPFTPHEAKEMLRTAMVKAGFTVFEREKKPRVTSAGQGVEGIDKILPVAELKIHLNTEYKDAKNELMKLDIAAL